MNKKTNSWRIIGAIASKDIVDGIKNRTILIIIGGLLFFVLINMSLPLLLKARQETRIVVYDAGESTLLTQVGAGSELTFINQASRDGMMLYVGESMEAFLGVVIPEDFDTTLEAGEQVKIQGYAPRWADLDEIDDSANALKTRVELLSNGEIVIDYQDNLVFPQPDSDGQSFLISMGLTLATVLVSIFIVPHLIIEEKETDTIKTLLISPASISQMVMGKSLAGLTYGLVAGGMVLIFSRKMIVNWELALLAILAGAFFAVALGLLFGTAFNDSQNLNIWLGIILVALILPPFLVQTMSAKWPVFLQRILPWSPTVSLSNLFRIAFSDQVPMNLVMTHFGVLLGSGVVLLAIVVLLVSRMDR